jgi:hypothetical protein
MTLVDAGVGRDESMGGGSVRERLYPTRSTASHKSARREAAVRGER